VLCGPGTLHRVKLFNPSALLEVEGNPLFLYPEVSRGIILLPGENRRDIGITINTNPELSRLPAAVPAVAPRRLVASAQVGGVQYIFST